MVETIPPDIRSEIRDDEFGGFQITIPAPPGPQLGYGCGLAAWAVVMGIAILAMISDTRPGRNYRPVLEFLGLWAIVGLFIAYSFAHHLTGREVVKIDEKTLVLRSEILGYSRVLSFDRAKLRNLRPVRQGAYATEKYWRGAVAFDHGGKTDRFGEAVSEHEARRLVKTIQQRFPVRDDLDDVKPLPVIT